MAIKNRFNLINEPWIPVAGSGLVSLSEIFSNPKLTGLGGNPIQKISVIKLLLAIAQAAYTPKDDEDWKRLGAEGLAKQSLGYLDSKRDLFWLYGKNPFLQMPQVFIANLQSFGALQPYVATGNTTVLMQSQIESPMNDADKASLVLLMMGFALGGKKTDNGIVLSSGYKGKVNNKGRPSTGKPGPSVGFLGFLHTFVTGSSICETIWLNLFSKEDIQNFQEGVGIPPWEAMPKGEDCVIAQRLKKSYMGRLIPLSRFVLISETGIHYSEGIMHPGYADGSVDMSVAVDFSRAKPKVLWTDSERRPWRQLTALLSFFDSGSTQKTFDCPQLRIGIQRAKKHLNQIGVWAGGLRISSNAGEQYVSGNDDFVESEVIFNALTLREVWFAHLKNEMGELENLSKIVYGATLGFFKTQKVDGTEQARQAANLFWQLSERKFQELVNACNDDLGREVKILRREFAGFVNKAYDMYCPKDTSRQIDAWAANKPNLSRYLS